MLLSIRSFRASCAFACLLAATGSSLADDGPAEHGAGAFLADVDNDGFVGWYVARQPSSPYRPQALSEFWIGIDGIPADDALRAQLDVPAGQGLVVNQVVDDSPASKAGLKQYDILLSCFDRPLAEVGDLAKIIEEKKEMALPIKLIRSGRQIIVDVTPQKRPPGQTGDTCPAISRADDATFIRRAWLDLLGTPPGDGDVQRFVAETRDGKRERLVNGLLRQSTIATRSCTKCHAEDAGGRWFTNLSQMPIGLRHRHSTPDWAGNALYWKHVVGFPGAVVREDGRQSSEATPKLPDDVSVSLTLKGSEPPKITINKGESSWGVSRPDDFQNLPEDIRAYVGALLASVHGNSGAPRFRYDADERGDFIWWLRKVDWLPSKQVEHHDLSAAGGAPATSEQQTAPAGTAFQRLDKQLKSLTTQLGDLRKAMHELQKAVQSDKEKAAAGETK